MQTCTRLSSDYRPHLLLTHCYFRNEELIQSMLGKDFIIADIKNNNVKLEKQLEKQLSVKKTAVKKRGTPNSLYGKKTEQDIDELETK